MKYGHDWIHFDKRKQAKRNRKDKRKRESIMTPDKIINNSSFFNPMDLLHSSKQAGLTFRHDNDSHKSQMKEGLNKIWILFFCQLKHALTVHDCQIKNFFSNTYTRFSESKTHTRYTQVHMDN